jgi:nitroreductase
MDVMEAIRSRRSIFKFKPEPVPKDVIERIYEAAIWAPNHHLTEPWRFVVIGEETKEILAQRYSEIQEAKAADGVSDEARVALKKAGYAKFMSKPTIIAVVCLQDGDEVKKREDYAAVCCAMQNVALAGGLTGWECSGARDLLHWKKRRLNCWGLILGQNILLDSFIQDIQRKCGSPGANRWLKF